eukprot:COSAG01_NODE_3812_length_5675_cov_2.804878_4_plen_116_part_00
MEGVNELLEELGVDIDPAAVLGGKKPSCTRARVSNTVVDQATDFGATNVDVIENAKKGDFKAIRDGTAETLLATLRSKLDPLLDEWAKSLELETQLLTELLDSIDTVRQHIFTMR